MEGSTAIPEVFLLSDLDQPQQSFKTIRGLLNAASMRKGSAFMFGVAYDAGLDPEMDRRVAATLKSTFNHGVAENNCKWRSTEPERLQFDMKPCESSRNFFLSHNATFRLHNTFWHQQLPKWLPGKYTESDVNAILRLSVEHVTREMNSSFSVDVLNEIVGDNVTTEMSVAECVESKRVWPITLQHVAPADLSFIETALMAARQGSPAKLLINDYSIGGNNAKTLCYLKLAEYLQSRGVPLDGIGFQSHVGAKWNNFDSKTALKSTFLKFADMGLSAAITEFDVWVQDSGRLSARWQAAIYGDYLDACLYSPNCQEFVVWGSSDSMSWLNRRTDRGPVSPLLFDSSMAPKLNYHELVARLQRYIAGTGEICDTAMGVVQCNSTNINN